MAMLLHGCWIWIVLSVALLVGTLCYQTEGHLFVNPVPPTRDECLYVSDNRGVALVVGVDPTQGALVEASLAASNNTTTNLTDKGVLLQILDNIGFGAGGLVIYEDILYVASLRIIARYNITNDLERMTDFIDISLVPFACLPDGLVASNGILYLSCGAFVGSNVTFPVASHRSRHINLILSFLFGLDLDFLPHWS